MTFYVLNNLFNIAGMHAVFITLIHSLWIGAIMALLAGMIISHTKRQAPQLRYQLLTALLGSFTLCMILIFFSSLTTETHTVAGNGNAMFVAGNSPVIQSSVIQSRQKSVLDLFTSFMHANAGLIVSIWLMVIIFKCLQLISGLNSLQRMKRRWIMEPGDHWNKKLQALSVKIGIKRPVVFLQSSLAKVPMVIGHLKPFLLFPVGMLNALPADEVEAILLHELAHIKRNDFLINLLQQFAEIFFFFNPAVLWLSSLIKNERENCCDDMALSITLDKKIYIHALVVFQEYRAGLIYATAFPGSKNHLLNRVKRIITNNNKTLNNMEKLVLASGIIITCLAIVAFQPQKTGFITNQKVAGSNATITGSKSNDNKKTTGYFSYADTLPNESIGREDYNINYNGDIDGKKVRLKEENNTVKELYIDEKKIPENQYVQYQPLIDKIHTQMRKKVAMLKLRSDTLDLEKRHLEQQEKVMDMNAEEMREQSGIANTDMKKQQELMELKEVEIQNQNEHAQQNDSAMNMESQKMEQDFMRKEDELKEKQTELKEKLEKLQLQQQKLELRQKDSAKVSISVHKTNVVSVKPSVVVKPVNSVKSAVKVNPVAMVTTTANAYANPRVTLRSSVGAESVVTVRDVSTLAVADVVLPRSNSTTDEIISDLEDANVISSTQNLSFQLTNNSLIVNGVKQPENIHQKIIQKYQVKPGDKISVSYSNHHD